MKKLLYIFIGIFLSQSVYSQNNINKNHIIELGEYFSNFMFGTNPPKATSKNLGVGYDANLNNSVLFIKEVTKQKNKILTDAFLKLPDTTTLKVIYIIDALHQNPNLKTPKKPMEVVDSLLNTYIPRNLLIDNYYNLVFVSVGNKNQPFDMSKIDFNLSNYGFENNQEKAIFYLRCMDLCGTVIFGYMNIVDPPNTKKALENILKYPKFNGLLYYQYTNLFFDDFKTVINNDSPPESYKDYYINKLFETILSHALCLKKEKSQQDVQDLLMKSVLKDEKLWKHTKFQGVLEKIYKKME